LLTNSKGQTENQRVFEECEKLCPDFLVDDSMGMKTGRDFGKECLSKSLGFLYKNNKAPGRLSQGL